MHGKVGIEGFRCSFLEELKVTLRLFTALPLMTLQNCASTSFISFIWRCFDFTRIINIDAMRAALKHNIVKSAVKSSFDI